MGTKASGQTHILISDSCNALLTGFGLAEVKNEFRTGITTSAGLHGDLRYASPEQLVEEYPHPTIPADVWAFGCLLLEVSEAPL